MTDTWGIPGPLFTGLYLGLLLLPALVGAVRAGLLRLGHAGGAPERPEELALLTGGRRRFGEFVVAKLLEQQVARLAGDGRLTRVTGTVPDNVGREALNRIGKRGTSVERVCEATAAHQVATGLETALIGRGLLTDPRKARSTWVATAVAYWAVIVLGVVRLIAGTSTGHPVGHLVGLLLLGTVAAIAVTVKARKQPSVKTTAAGRAAAEAARRAGVLTTGAAGAVAAGGLTAHPDEDVQQAVTRAARQSTARAYNRRKRFAGAGSGTAVGFYSGSSCGGGSSSCGGGGGGCGGGGGGGGCGG